MNPISHLSLALVFALILVAALELTFRDERRRLPLLLTAVSGIALWTTHSLLVFVCSWLVLHLAPGLERRRRLYSAGVATSTLALLYLAFEAHRTHVLWAHWAGTSFASLVLEHPWAALIPIATTLFRPRRSLVGSEALLFFLSHPGVALAVRLLSALGGASLDRWSTTPRVLLIGICLFQAVYQTGIGLARRDYVRALACILYSQGALLLAGVASGRVGIRAASALAFVMALSYVPLSQILDDLRSHYRVEGIRGCEGLAAFAPRSNAVFLFLGFCLVGSPGTLAFVGEDLLFHALLDFSGWYTLGFILASCLNAVVFYRIYSQLFLGPPLTEEGMQAGWDLPTFRSRSYALLGALLVVTGIFPRLFFR